MNDTDLPALPPAEAVGPEVCNIVRLYLAVSRDLAPDQVRAVAAHVKTCPNCTREHKLVSRATQLIGNMEEAIPSARVDQAVLAAIAARTGNHTLRAPQSFRTTAQRRRRAVGVPLRVSGLVAVAAVLLIAAVATLHFMPFSSPQQAFALPARVSWNDYVLHHTQTRMSSAGEAYEITTYHDLGTGQINVETTMDGGKKLDVMLVGEDNKVLALDMNKHVAQWGANEWNVDDSMFDLAQLRDDLKAKRANYLGKATFKGQEVYRIRDDNGLVLLLNMDYKPVNVLKNANDSGTGQPLYNSLELLQRSQAESSMMDMKIPAGFKQGQISSKP